MDRLINCLDYFQWLKQSLVGRGSMACELGLVPSVFGKMFATSDYKNRTVLSGPDQSFQDLLRAVWVCY